MLLSGNPPADREPVAVSDVQLPPSFVALALVQWGTSGSAQLQTATDGVRLLPAGRNTEFLAGYPSSPSSSRSARDIDSADVTVVGAKGKTRTGYRFRLGGALHAQPRPADHEA